MVPAIVFRADASLDIGTGHVMRCLTIADALRDRGVGCGFVCRELPGHLINAIVARGYPTMRLAPPEKGGGGPDPVPHAKWLGVGWERDARDAGAALTAFGPAPADWLVVDHYALDARWEAAMRPFCQRLLVIDDLADRPHNCDALIDQNIGRLPQDYTALVGEECLLMTGTSCALLRPEFAALRDASLRRRIADPVRSLLISMGGIDKENATGVVLTGLADCALPPQLMITVVMGRHAPWLEEVRRQAEVLPWHTKVMVDVSDMAAQMAAADIAIGAAGTTTWERSCLGLPSLVLGTAENQNYVLSQLKARNVAVLGDVNQLHAHPQELAMLMDHLIEHRLEYSRRAAELTDGGGCARLVDLLLGASSPVGAA
jgi:UDP-2,4-diacetamido-2,4,6-trideoxy-beta-L-altropyranose hydrolase